MTERKSLESERADDLLQHVRDLIKAGIDDCLTSADIIRNVSLAIRLAAQDQNPVAWVIKFSRGQTDATTDPDRAAYWRRVDPGATIDAAYLPPPPAAGWAITDDMVMAGARAIADLEDVGVDPLIVEHSKACLKAALRRNAPPDPGAGKSADPGERISNLAADLVVSGWVSDSAQDVERSKKEAERKLLAFACDEIERHMKRDPSMLPDHGGADAGVDWTPFEDGTAPWSEDEQFEEADKACKSRCKTYGKSTCEGEFEGNCTECEHDAQVALRKKYLSHQPAPVEKPVPRAENDPGRCFMAASTICENIADTEGDPSGAKSGSKYLEGFYDGSVRCATVLREKITEPPAPVAANASAEARLREALIIVRDMIANEMIANAVTNIKTMKPLKDVVEEALSAHPHASDCDKQGER